MSASALHAEVTLVLESSAVHISKHWCSVGKNCWGCDWRWDVSEERPCCLLPALIHISLSARENGATLQLWLMETFLQSHGADVHPKAWVERLWHPAEVTSCQLSQLLTSQSQPDPTGHFIIRKIEDLMANPPQAKSYSTCRPWDFSVYLSTESLKPASSFAKQTFLTALSSTPERNCGCSEGNQEENYY